MFVLLLPPIRPQTASGGSRCGSVVQAGGYASGPIGNHPLSHFVWDKNPWEHFESNEDQRQPLYWGATPREMVFFGKQKKVASLPQFLRFIAESHAQKLRVFLALDSAEFEAWPVHTQFGEWTWAFARYRETKYHAWKWLSGKDWTGGKNDTPILPWKLDPQIASERSRLFDDYLNRPSLYTKPASGNAIWTSRDGQMLLGAWLPLNAITLNSPILSSGKAIARVLPQPPRLNAEPFTFVLWVDAEKTVWKTEINWKLNEEPLPLPKPGSPISFSRDFTTKYASDIRILTAEEEAVFPLSQKQMRFTKKNPIQADHQLNDLVEYLEERYMVMGLKSVRQRFTWRGIAQSNLIAIIPGHLRGKNNRPVLLVDHIDTAFSEDVFEKKGRRIAVPGADDNVTATAALLRAAEELKDTRPLNDIWLCHLTGEEFPAEDLGARHLVSKLLDNKQDVSAIIVLDMIGFHRRGDRVFQVNAADASGSNLIASTALAVAKGLSIPWRAVYRPPYDPRNYGYNSDMITFSEMGFPVILINEHLNGMHMRNPHYHQLTDRSHHVDVTFASDLAKVAIETVARFAQNLSPTLDNRSK